MKRYLLALVAVLACLPSAPVQAQNLIHRYSFHGSANDSVGTANGTIIGNVTIQTDGSSPMANGTAVFGGGTMTSSPSYISLPPSVVSGLQNASIEIFTTNFNVPNDNGGNGSRYQTLFAAATANPDTTNYMILSPDRGTPSGLDALGIATRISNGSEINAVAVNPLPAWVQNHVIDVVYSGFTGIGSTGTETLYLDGTVVASTPTTLSFAAMNATPEGIAQVGIGGGSPFNDPTFSGSINEVRIFDNALSTTQIAANVAAGPGTVAAAPVMTLSGVAISNITPYGATITWSTSNVSSDLVNYGTTTQYGSALYGTGNTTAHSVTLSSLQPGTTYHFLVSSTDNYGQSATGTDQTFTTAPPAELVSLQTPSQLPAGGTGTGTVSLNAPAPVGGAVITLSTRYGEQATVPATVTILGGQTSASFPVTALTIGNQATVAITAFYNGISLTQQTTVVASGSVGLSFSPTDIGPSGTSTGTVVIANPAAPGGVPIDLSSDSAAVTVPASVVIPGGQTNATFSALGNSVAQTTTAHITATMTGAGSSTPQALTVEPASVTGLRVAPASVIGGTSDTGTVTLSAIAPTGGLTVSLESGDPSVMVPTTVIVPDGSTTGTFPITTTPVGQITPVTLSASEDPSFPQTPAGATQTASLTVTPPTVTALTLTPSAVFGGNDSTGTITLSDPAPADGLTVNVQSSNTASATVPATVTVAAGQTTATFPITTAAVAATVTISASTDASFPTSPVGATQTALLTVSTVGFTLSVNPSTVSLGTPATGTITLSGPAPTGGLTMYLEAYNPIAGESTPASVPSSVTVAAGATTATFPVTTQAVSTGTSVTLLASASSTFPTGATQSTTLTVAASGISVSLAASTATAGTPVTGTVTLSGPAPTGGETVNLASSNASAASVPSTVTVASGATAATFQISTYSAATGIVITATTPQGQSGTASVTVTANSGYSYAAGWDLVSLPYDYSNLTPAQIFGFSTANLFQWSPMSLQYVTTAATTANAVHPGIGYWVYLPQGGQVTTVGTPTDTSQPFSVAVLPGWNMIGDPFSTSVSVSGLTATVNTSVYPYGSAGSLLPALYGYTPGASGTVGTYNLLGSDGTLVSGQGYWLYATQSLTLTFPAPNPVGPPPPAAPGARQ
jgi:hypothetical protein